jgi:hypothetical protein
MASRTIHESTRSGSFISISRVRGSFLLTGEDNTKPFEGITLLSAKRKSTFDSRLSSGRPADFCYAQAIARPF